MTHMLVTEKAAPDITQNISWDEQINADVYFILS